MRPINAPGKGVVALEPCPEHLDLEVWPETPFLGVARANDADDGAYHQPFLQVPHAFGAKKFALVVESHAVPPSTSHIAAS